MSECSKTFRRGIPGVETAGRQIAKARAKVAKLTLSVLTVPQVKGSEYPHGEEPDPFANRERVAGGASFGGESLFLWAS